MEKPQAGETQMPIPEAPALLMSGLDSLYVSFFLDVTRGALDWDELALAKERVQQSHDQSFSEIRLGNETFALMPYGKKPYRYVLSNRLFEVRLAERMSPSATCNFSVKGFGRRG